MLIFTCSQFQQRLSSYVNVKKTILFFLSLSWQTNILSLVQLAIMFLCICFSGIDTFSSDTDSHLTIWSQHWKKLWKTLFNSFLYNSPPSNIYFILATEYQSFIVYDSIPHIHFKGFFINTMQCLMFCYYCTLPHWVCLAQFHLNSQILKNQTTWPELPTANLVFLVCFSPLLIQPTFLKLWTVTVAWNLQFGLLEE